MYVQLETLKYINLISVRTRIDENPMCFRIVHTVLSHIVTTKKDNFFFIEERVQLDTC